MSDPIKTFLGLVRKLRIKIISQNKFLDHLIENFFVFKLSLPQILFLKCIIIPLSLTFLTFGEFDLEKPISSPPEVISQINVRNHRFMISPIPTDFKHSIWPIFFSIFDFLTPKRCTSAGLQPSTCLHHWMAGV